MLLRQRRFAILFAIVFANFLGATVVTPTLPLYAQFQFGASPQTISFILASFFIAQFIAAPWLGRLSDRYGRLPILLISQAGTCVSFVLLATAGSLPMLFIARILDGITGGNVIVAQAYVTDITPREQRTQGLGIIFAAFGLGYIIGPGIGGLIAHFFGQAATFWAGALFSLITVILTFLFLDESLTEEKRAERAERTMKLNDPHRVRHAIFGSRALMLCLLIGFAAQFSIALLQATISLFAELRLFPGQTPDQATLGIGVMLTGIGLGQFAAQMLVLRRALRWFGERRLVIIGAFFRGLGMVLIILLPTPLAVGAIALVMIAVASGVMMPSLQSLTTTTAPEDISGSILGVYNASTTLGLIAGTTLGGTLYTIVPELPFAVAGAVLWLAIIPAVLLYRRTQSLTPAGAAIPAHAAAVGD